MKYLKIAILLLCTFQQVKAQEQVTITFSENSDLRLNDLEITDSTAFEAVKDEIGEASRVIEKVDGKIYIYDNGLSINVISGAVMSMSINFNWDGDKNVSENTFTGRFLVNKTEITKELTGDEVLAIDGLEVICPIPIMCGSKDKTPGVINTLIAFEDSKITQFGFILNR